ncbi:MAG TPA: FGGY family carbohydrate kinase [Cyclobacteriaceae bacterium]|nr:FGGY family carbohydrate kinase [Cyclobacteriaceae bacterium]
MIAVFDIGKTNKKLFVFDEDYNIVYETSSHLNEIVDEDGDACEDIHALTKWIRDTFNQVIQNSKFDIRAINFSTYGASFVHLGNDGLPAAPLYNYLKPFPEDLKNKFYATYGGEKTFAKITASPVLGSLNSGMILYLLKHRKPEIFRRIRQSLHLPQYVSSLFTSAYCSDLTSIGCHTNLWDFEANNYHAWVNAEGVEGKLAPIRHSDSAFEIKAGSRLLYSGIGLHDSSSALIPYINYATEPFVLLSTGTWCIALNPFNSDPLTVEELGQDCLSYLTYEGNPVKASRLFLGHEHEEGCKHLTTQFNVDPEAYRKVDIDRVETPFEAAYVLLIKRLINKQISSLELVLQSNIKTIFVDGGFSQNKIFMTLLAEAYPDLKVYAASVVQASALGAALVIHDDWNSKPVRKDLLKLIAYHSNGDKP